MAPEDMSGDHQLRMTYGAGPACLPIVTSSAEEETRCPGQNDGSKEDSTPSKTEIQSDGDAITYPEGGLRAWLVVFGSLCAMIASFGLMNSIGVFQEYLGSHQLKDHNAGTIGWIFGVYVFLSFFCGLQIGPVFDAKGPRLLVLSGSILIIAALMLLGICTKYWHFLIVFGFLGGIGTSLTMTPTFASIGHFFMVRRGRATGVAACGGSIGGIVFPLILQSLFPRVGFAWGTRVIGFISVVLLIVANLLIKSRLPPRKGAKVTPNLKILKDPIFFLTTCGVFLVEWGLFTPLTYISSYAVAHGKSQAFAYHLLAIFNAGSCFGRWIPGYFADKLGRFNTMILTITLCLTTTLAIWLPAGGSVAMMVTYAVLFGFASGSNISLTPVCVGQLCDTEVLGTYYATCYTIVSFG
ncbi:MAG: hypothetical protein M1816_005680 [Peltula sp. TS41687]|nr:MAG: hypothetical protein M1816_005680 [Peltula sp. TS41687]